VSLITGVGAAFVQSVLPVLLIGGKYVDLAALRIGADSHDFKVIFLSRNIGQFSDVIFIFLLQRAFEF